MGELKAAPASFMLNTWKIAGTIYFAQRLGSFFMVGRVAEFLVDVLTIVGESAEFSLYLLTGVGSSTEFLVGVLTILFYNSCFIVSFYST